MLNIEASSFSAVPSLSRADRRTQQTGRSVREHGGLGFALSQNQGCSLASEGDLQKERLVATCSHTTAKRSLKNRIRGCFSHHAVRDRSPLATRTARR